MTLTLTGYAYSVYTRSVRMALRAKGLTYEYAEFDPFEGDQAGRLRALHPFARVPVLEHDGFGLYETQAILDYVDTLQEDPPLSPHAPKARARMRQVMGIADSYMYWPMVRQAVSHAIFLPADDADTDRAMITIAAGLSKAPDVLNALNEIACERRVLVPGQLSLADCHLWPMMDYVRMIPEASDLLRDRVALWEWAEAMERHPAAQATRPDLDQLRECTA